MRAISVLCVLVIPILVSCEIEPKPIAYGEDACDFCKMTIVDKQHGAEVVTHKGKVFKFDASECMLNYMKDKDMESISLFLVNDFNSPGELINATGATFLISPNIPSPMGEYLTAFSTREAAEKARQENDGELYQWENLILRFQK